jgi:hypothetical protein
MIVNTKAWKESVSLGGKSMINGGAILGAYAILQSLSSTIHRKNNFQNDRKY